MRNNSKANAYAQWNKLSADDRETAMSALPGFQHYCTSNPDYRVIHAERFLKHRRFEGYQPITGSATSSNVGPNGRRWGWWRGGEEKYRSWTEDDWEQTLTAARPNDTWPWWLLGAPPGHQECLIPEPVLTRRGLIDKYRGGVTAENVRGKGELKPDWWRERVQSARLLPSEWWRNVIAKHANGRWPVEYLGPCVFGICEDEVGGPLGPWSYRPQAGSVPAPRSRPEQLHEAAPTDLAPQGQAP